MWPRRYCNPQLMERNLAGCSKVFDEIPKRSTLDFKPNACFELKGLGRGYKLDCSCMHDMNLVNFLWGSTWETLIMLSIDELMLPSTINVF